MALDRNLSILVKFAMLDRLTAPMRKVAGGTGRLKTEIADARRELAGLERSQAAVARFKGMEDRLRSESAAIEKQRKTVEQLRAAYQSTDAPTKTLTKNLADAEAKEQRLIARHEEQGRALQQLAAKLGAAGIDISDLAQQESRLGREAYETSRRLKAQQAELDRLGEARSRMEKTQALGGKLQGAGLKGIAGGAAMGAPLLGAVDDMRVFESGMTDIAQKANMTRAAAAGMGERLVALAPKVNQLPEALREGVDQLAGFGLDPKQAEKMIAPIGKAATTYKAEIADLSRATFAATDNLKVPIGQTAKALDVMATAGNAGAFELKDMAQYFPELTAAAQGLGQSGVGAVADLSAALQITRKGAGDSASAANNLNNLLAKINTKDTIKNFKDFGVDLPAAMKKAYAEGKTPIEAITELTNSALGGDMSKLAFLFGDMQVQQALRPLIQYLPLYRQIRAEALAASGTVERDFATRMQDGAEKSRALSIRMKALGLTVGAMLLPSVNALIDRATATAAALGAWMQQHPALAAALVKMAALIAGVLVVGGALALTIGTILGPFALMRFGITQALPLLKPFGVALRFVSSGFLRLAAAMLLNPWGLLIAAIAIAAYLIYSHWDKIKAAWQAGVAALGRAWAALRAMFGAGLAWLSGAWTSFKSFGANLIQGLIDGITARLAALKGTIVGVASSAAAWFKEKLGIHSPSRVFMGLGGFVTQGLAHGVAAGSQEPIDRIRSLAGRMATALAIGAAAPGYAATAGAGTAAPGAGAGVYAPTYNITIQGGAGASAQDLAKAIRAELEKFDRERAAARRSSFADRDD